MEVIVPVHAEDVHEVFFEGLTVLFFVTGTVSLAFLEGNGTSFNIGPGEHGWITTGSREPLHRAGREQVVKWELEHLIHHFVVHCHSLC
jgi:hypothetical protein